MAAPFESWFSEEVNTGLNRFKTNLEAIIEKYDKPFENSDVLDLQTMTIIEDHGELSSHQFQKRTIGSCKLADMTKRDWSRLLDAQYAGEENKNSQQSDFYYSSQSQSQRVDNATFIVDREEESSFDESSDAETILSSSESDSEDGSSLSGQMPTVSEDEDGGWQSDSSGFSAISPENKSATKRREQRRTLSLQQQIKVLCTDEQDSEHDHSSQIVWTDDQSDVFRRKETVCISKDSSCIYTSGAGSSCHSTIKIETISETVSQCGHLQPPGGSNGSDTGPSSNGRLFLPEAGPESKTKRIVLKTAGMEESGNLRVAQPNHPDVKQKVQNTNMSETFLVSQGTDGHTPKHHVGMIKEREVPSPKFLTQPKGYGTLASEPVHIDHVDGRDKLMGGCQRITLTNSQATDIAGSYSKSPASTRIRLTNSQATDVGGSYSKSPASNRVRLTNSQATDFAGSHSKSPASNRVCPTNSQATDIVGSYSKSPASNRVRLTNSQATDFAGSHSKSPASNRVCPTNSQATDIVGSYSKSPASNRVRLTNSQATDFAGSHSKSPASNRVCPTNSQATDIVGSYSKSPASNRVCPTTSRATDIGGSYSKSPASNRVRLTNSQATDFAGSHSKSPASNRVCPTNSQATDIVGSYSKSPASNRVCPTTSRATDIGGSYSKSPASNRVSLTNSQAADIAGSHSKSPASNRVSLTNSRATDIAGSHSKSPASNRVTLTNSRATDIVGSYSKSPASNRVCFTNSQATNIAGGCSTSPAPDRHLMNSTNSPMTKTPGSRVSPRSPSVSVPARRLNGQSLFHLTTSQIVEIFKSPMPLCLEQHEIQESWRNWSARTGNIRQGTTCIQSRQSQLVPGKAGQPGQRDVVKADNTHQSTTSDVQRQYLQQNNIKSVKTDRLCTEHIFKGVNDHFDKNLGNGSELKKPRRIIPVTLNGAETNSNTTCNKKPRRIIPVTLNGAETGSNATCNKTEVSSEPDWIPSSTKLVSLTPGSCGNSRMLLDLGDHGHSSGTYSLPTTKEVSYADVETSMSNHKEQEHKFTECQMKTELVGEDPLKFQSSDKALSVHPNQPHKSIELNQKPFFGPSTDIRLRRITIHQDPEESNFKNDKNSKVVHVKPIFHSPPSPEKHDNLFLGGTTDQIREVDVHTPRILKAYTTNSPSELMSQMKPNSPLYSVQQECVNKHDVQVYHHRTETGTSHVDRAEQLQPECKEMRCLERVELHARHQSAATDETCSGAEACVHDSDFDGDDEGPCPTEVNVGCQKEKHKALSKCSVVLFKMPMAHSPLGPSKTRGKSWRKNALGANSVSDRDETRSQELQSTTGHSSRAGSSFVQKTSTPTKHVGSLPSFALDGLSVIVPDKQSSGSETSEKELSEEQRSSEDETSEKELSEEQQSSEDETSEKELSEEQEPSENETSEKDFPERETFEMKISKKQYSDIETSEKELSEEQQPSENETSEKDFPERETSGMKISKKQFSEIETSEKDCPERETSKMKLSEKMYSENEPCKKGSLTRDDVVAYVNSSSDESDDRTFCVLNSPLIKTFRSDRGMSSRDHSSRKRHGSSKATLKHVLKRKITDKRDNSLGGENNLCGNLSSTENKRLGQLKRVHLHGKVCKSNSRSGRKVSRHRDKYVYETSARSSDTSLSEEDVTFPHGTDSGGHSRRTGVPCREHRAAYMEGGSSAKNVDPCSRKKLFTDSSPRRNREKHDVPHLPQSTSLNVSHYSCSESNPCNRPFCFNCI